MRHGCGLWGRIDTSAESAVLEYRFNSSLHSGSLGLPFGFFAHGLITVTFLCVVIARADVSVAHNMPEHVYSSLRDFFIALILALGPRLRRATVEDASAIHNLMAHVPDMSGSEAWWNEQLRKQWRRWFVLELPDKKLVGCCGCSMRQGSYGLPRRGHIPFLAIDPKCRRRGYGSRLLRVAIAELDFFDAISLFVRADNKAALHLYRSCGFERHKAVPNYYADGAVRTALLCVRWRDASTG